MAQPQTIMALVAIRVLIINPRIDFAVSIKKALEDTGAFEVYPFTGVETALDFLRGHPQDVALVDSEAPGVRLDDFVSRARGLQPDIAIIASPRRIDAQIIRKLGLQDTLDLPFTARDIIPLLQHALQDRLDMLPDTREVRQDTPEESETLLIPPRAPASGKSAERRPPPTLPEFSSLDKLVVHSGEFEKGLDGGDTLHVELETPVNPPPPAAPVSKTFERLAAEEPPMPGGEDTGTVADLRVGVSNAFLAEVLDIMREDTPTPGAPAAKLDDHDTPLGLDPKFDEDVEQGETTARLILRLTKAELETPQNDDFSLDAAVRKLASQLPENTRPTQPMPEWLNAEKSLREPDFLRDNLPRLDQESTAQTTRTANEKIVSNPQSLETDRLKPKPPQPPRIPEFEQLITDKPAVGRGLPASTGAQDDDSSLLHRTEIVELQSDFFRLAAFELPPDVVSARAATAIVPDPDDFDALMADDDSQDILEQNAQIAQLAVNLTQASLDLTAEATLITQGGQIVAYSGSMPDLEVQEIRDAIGGDWEVGEEGTRVRFLTLASSGKEYLLYTRRSVDDFTLSMVFAGTTPLRDIRRQGKALVDALLSVPAPKPLTLPEPVLAVQEVPPAQVDVGPLTPYTYLWLLSDPASSLAESVRAGLARELRRHLENEGWHFVTLHIDEDYVYIHANVPGERTGNEVVRDLKNRSAQIAARLDNSLPLEFLWATSYLVVTPGRPLDQEEIQSFIQFDRMA